MSCAQAFCPLASDVHAELLSRYQHGFASLADVPDDGYFLQVSALPPQTSCAMLLTLH
jgi:hypothetical protein